ncbi:hypothetical protein STAL104432_31345 [Streptomyces albus]
MPARGRSGDAPSGSGRAGGAPSGGTGGLPGSRAGRAAPVVGGEEPARQHDDGLDAAVDVVAELDDDPVPAGQGGDQIEPDAAVAYEGREVDAVGLGEHRVHVVPVAGAHPEAAVLDLDGDSRGDALGAHQDLGLGGGEHRGVLDQFGQQMDDVRDGVPAHGALDGRDELDPGILLDLRDGGPQHLGEVDGTVPTAVRRGAAEDGEVLGVAADPGGEMVDGEDPFEQVGVVDVVLQLVDEPDLAVREGLEPAREVTEDGRVFLVGFLTAVVALSGEGGCLGDGGFRTALGERDPVGEQVESVADGLLPGCGSAGYRAFAVPQGPEHGVEFGLSSGGGAAQGRAPFGGTACFGRGEHGGGGDHGGGDQEADHQRCPRGGPGWPCAVAVRQQAAGDDGSGEGGQPGGQGGEPHQTAAYGGVARRLAGPGFAVPAVCGTAGAAGRLVGRGARGVLVRRGFGSGGSYSVRCPHDGAAGSSHGILEEVEVSERCERGDDRMVTLARTPHPD